MRLLSFITSLFLSITLIAQIEDPVSWNFESKHLGDGEFELIATATIEKGWFIYSQDLAEDGPVPTSFEYEPRNTRYNLLGRTAEDGDFIEGFDKIFEMNVKKFKNKATFKQRVKLKKKSAKITGFLTYMTCDNEKCLPPEDIDFEYKLNSNSTVGKPEKVTRETKTKAAAPIAKPVVSNKEKKTEELADKAAKETPKTPEKPIENLNATADLGGNKQSGILDPVKWTINSLNEKDGIYKLTFTANIEDGWYVYSQDVDDNGPVPTSIEFEENDQVEFLQEKLTEKSDHVKEGFDKLFDMHIKKFAVQSAL